MSVREMLEMGLISQLRDPELQNQIDVELILDDIIPDDNYFELKNILTVDNLVYK